MPKIRLRALLLVMGLATTNVYAQGQAVVLGTVTGISKSDAELSGEGRDTVLSTTGMRSSNAELAGEGPDTFLSTEMAPQPRRRTTARPSESSMSDLATLAYIAHATGRSIPGNAANKASAAPGTAGPASN